MNKFIVLIFLGSLVLSCNRQSGIVNRAALKGITSIAVLPVEVIMSGKQPARLKAEQIERIEEAESKMLQGRIQESVVNATMGRKKRNVAVIDMDKVNNNIVLSGSSVRSSWSVDTEKLAKLAGADAVIRARMTKTRYMSNLASYGTSVGADVLDILKKFYVPGALISDSKVEGSGVMKKTHSVDVNVRLISAKDGSVLWSFSDVFDSDWDTSVDQSIAESLGRMALRFPAFK